MSEQEIAGVMAEAMDAENRRRQAAADSPGLGYQLALPQSPAAAAVGKSGLDMPAIGEGYDQAAADAFQHKSYGPAAPVYGPAEVGGLGYPLGISQPARRHVADMGADGLLIEPYGNGQQPYTAVSPPAARPSLWARLTGRLRRR